jgi:serine/threonine-protein kinase
MPFSAGDKLGPYEILAAIGAGGMGEVYRAHDSRLNRDVAIKALPAAFANDADRVARFQREAQVLAALNHPNIAAIYGIEQSGLVMELVEGHNLAGPVPIDDAIVIARQIADALDAAHQKNIVHRDLKPANVKITPEGRVKVLDFGLAKALDANPVNADPSNSPTLSMESTRAGVILGTAGYMSPEQARGKPVDKRADIWSFGVVFYELLTGRRAFQGETMSDTLAAVLRADLDWTRLPAGTPVGVRRLLERCLERDPNQRLRDIGDAWNEIDRPPDTQRESKVHWVPWALASLMALVAAAAWEWSRAPLEPLRTVTRSAMILPELYTPALSRDGTRLAYADSGGGPNGQLMLRNMNELVGKPIPGAIGVEPVFSPDGQWIAYRSTPAPFHLKKIPVVGGASVTLCDLSGGELGSWNADDTILVGSTKGVMRVPAAGGVPEFLTTVKAGESGHFFPELLPGGQAILFGVRTGSAPESSQIAVLDLKTHAHHTLVNAGHTARYVAPSVASSTGDLVYMRGKTLFAAPFDLKRLAVTGAETAVVEGIEALAEGSDRGQYTFSDSSVLVYQAADPSRELPSTLQLTDRKGFGQTLPEPPHRWGSFVVSPNGNLIAGSIRGAAGSSEEGHKDIWVYDIERRTLTRLTFEGINGVPLWTPDGKWVTFTSSRDGKHEIYRIAADRSGPPELLLAAESHYLNPFSWTRDGKTLLYCQLFQGRVEIWTLPAPGSGGDGKPRPFTQTSTADQPRISPDGKWVAYNSSESGKEEIYVVPFSGPGGNTQVSTQGGEEPVWSPSGRELFYDETSTNQVMAIDIPAGPLLRAGRPKALFKLDVDAGFDVMPDGKRFLVERVPGRATTITAVTITNWFDDLRRRAPVKH